MSQQLPPSAVLVKHRVADYGVWKKAFDEHVAARKDATALGHHINRGADDANMLLVYCPVGNADKMKAFFDNPAMGEVMKSAGVEGPPTITFMTPKSADFLPESKVAGIIVEHDVEDYDTWRAAYDDFDSFRKESGIIGHAVNHEMGNPNHVIVYHQANDLDTLRKFLDSAELKTTMEKAGVKGPPAISFVQGDDWAEY